MFLAPAVASRDRNVVGFTFLLYLFLFLWAGEHSDREARESWGTRIGSAQSSLFLVSSGFFPLVLNLCCELEVPSGF